MKYRAESDLRQVNNYAFIRDALEAGFTEEQAEFMEEYLARVGHSHEIEDIEGLEDALDNSDSD